MSVLKLDSPIQARHTRRSVVSMTMGAVLGASLLRWRDTLAIVREQAPGIKLSVLASLNPTDDDLKFLNEVGYQYVFCTTQKLMSVDEMLAAKKRFSNAGIVLDNIRYFTGGPAGYTDMADIVLNRPGRAQAIENAKTWIRNSGTAGFHYTGSSLSITGVWASGQTNVRGGAMARDYDEASPNVKGSNPRDAKSGRDTLYFGRDYSKEEVLDNFKKYFVQEIVPVAEQAGVCIGFHPDDPPTYDKLGGVPRIFGTFDKVKQIFDLANSPNIGLMMCCGTWVEGGTRMGAEVTDAIRYFGQRKKFWEVHFRNVSAPLPHFHETYMDNGYYDMFRIMKTLVEIGYNGTVNLDHTPQMVGAPYAYPAYAIGYMKACLQRAQAESKP